MSTTTPPSLADPTTARPDDLAAIERIIRDTEIAFNTHDAELLAEHFAADATTVGVNGSVLVGRDEILATSRRLFAGPLSDQYAVYEIDDVRFVRPDVAVVRKLARAVDGDGVAIDVGHTMVAHYVMVRDEGRWWVVNRQNTLITT